jgi:peptide chain release factor 2
MGAPGFWDIPEKAQRTIQALKPLTGLLKPYQELRGAADDLGALCELAEEHPEVEGELAGELARTEQRLHDFELRAKLSGPQDASNAFVRIQAGTGGTDACDFAQMLLRMYSRWAEANGYQVEVVDLLPNDEAGIRNAMLRIVGDYAFGRMQSESGVHRLVRISPFDANAKRQTSFAAVDVMPELSGDIEIDIRWEDIEMQTFSAGGPGGQHQNKTQSGVRLIHNPTGIVAECRNERSQHKNRDVAMQMLKAKMYRIEEQKRLAEVEKQYDEKGEVAWGYQIRNYVLQPYTKAEDRRTGAETSQVQKVLDGEIDEFIEAYLRQKTEREHRKGS